MIANLAERTWPQVEEYLQKRKSIIFPVGSTEQHGPTGLLGVDFMTAWKIAEELGKREGVMVAPPLCVGMAQHHMAFPGSLSFTPSTYILVIKELIQSLYHHGFRQILFINGHGGNIAPITSAFSEALMSCPDAHLKLANWWHLDEVTAYEKNHFQNQNGFHATCGELSVTQYLYPDAHLDINMPKEWAKQPDKNPWPLSATNFRRQFPDGRMHSSPQLANAEHGEKLFEIAVNSIAKMLNEMAPKG